MSALLQFSFQFSTITCYKCQISFAVPAQSKERWMANGELFWCPNGHSQAYCETEVQRLQKQIEQEKKRREWAEQSRDYSQKRNQTLEKQKAALKGVITKTRKRIANGVCPCCQRSFINLHKHIKHMHPNYSKE